MNLIDHKNGENLAFMRSLQFLPNFKLLDNQNQNKFRSKIPTFFEVFVHSRLRFFLPFFKFLSILGLYFFICSLKGHQNEVSCSL